VFQSGVEFRAKIEVELQKNTAGGPDKKIPPAPGTNPIAEFVEFRPLTS